MRSINWLRSGRSGTGLVLSFLGIAALVWGALAAPSHVAVLNARLVSSGPPCGANELCIHESQVPTTALAFSGGGCGDLISQNPSEDLWHFVIPNGAGFDANLQHFTAYFTGPSGSVHADSIGGPNNKFAYVYSPAGATLTWAFATNLVGTPTQSFFNLSGTCPASHETSTTTTSSSTKTTTSSTSTTTTTHTSSTTTATTTGSTTTSTGGVEGISTTNSSGAAAGVVSAPNTGAGLEIPAMVLGLLLLLAGVGCIAMKGKQTAR